MNDVLQDIETLESAVINLTEGASDEKRMAVYSPVSYTHLTLPTIYSV